MGTPISGALAIRARNRAYTALHSSVLHLRHGPPPTTPCSILPAQWLETEEMAGYVQPGGLVQTEASVAAAAASEGATVDMMEFATMQDSGSESENENDEKKSD